MSLSIQRSERSNTFCGPAALAALTGRHVDDVTYALRVVRNGRAVKSATSAQMVRALELMDHSVLPVPVHTLEERKYGAHPTLAATLRRLQDRSPDNRYLVLITGHYVVLQGRKVYDNRHPAGVFTGACPYRRRRVRAVWAVTGRSQAEPTWPTLR